MELKELKIAFDVGGLKECIVTTAAMDSGYILVFKRKGASVADLYMISQRDDQPRIFKTIDSAVANAVKVGFRDIKIKI